MSAYSTEYLHFTEPLRHYIFQQPKKSLEGKTNHHLIRKLGAFYAQGPKDNIIFKFTKVIHIQYALLHLIA